MRKPFVTAALTGYFLVLALMSPTSFAEQKAVLLKDINLVPQQQNTMSAFDTNGEIDVAFTKALGKVFFTANDGIHGYEPWVTDGTPEGTQLLKNIVSRPTFQGDSQASGTGFVEVNNLLYFGAVDTDFGYELWVTDGTSEGTQIVANLNRQANGLGYPFGLTEFDGKLYFTADNGKIGDELWVSDGTLKGTFVLKDINANNESKDPNSYSYSHTVFDGKLYFMANDGIVGDDLWVTDGTENGTVRVAADNRPPVGPVTFGFFEFAGKLYFTSEDPVLKDNTTSTNLMTTDGNSVAPFFVNGVNLYKKTTSFAALDGKLFFEAEDSVLGSKLFVTDGTAEDTKTMDEIKANSSLTSVASITNSNGIIYFTAEDDNRGSDVWVSDGTADGTKILDESDRGAPLFNENGTEFVEFGGKLFFSAQASLWMINGTTLTPVPVDGLTKISNTLVEAGGNLFFEGYTQAHGIELWMTDGTSEGTKMVKDIHPGPQFADIAAITSYNDKIVFTANDGYHGDEVWITDGTSENTMMLKDINRRFEADLSRHSMAKNYYEFDGKVFFNAANLDGQYNLWVTDGTAENTKLFLKLFAFGLTEFNGKLYFAAQAGASGDELWVSDGTPQNTALFKDINPAGDSWSYGFTVFGNKILFFADGGQGEDIYVSDGTPEGTTRLDGDNRPNALSGNFGVTEFHEFAGKLFFASMVPTQKDATTSSNLWTTDGSTVSPFVVDGLIFYVNSTLFVTAGGKLYFEALDQMEMPTIVMTDGTTAGTKMLSDIVGEENEGLSFGGQYGGGMIGYKDKLVFTGTNAQNGTEIWMTDGTSQGTVLVKDIVPGPESSDPLDFIEAHDLLYFSAWDPDHGVEPWRTDGTSSGTILVTDIDPAPTQDSLPFEYNGMIEYNGDLLFTAESRRYGKELWKVSKSEDISTESPTTAPTESTSSAVTKSNKLFGVTLVAAAVCVLFF